MAVGQYLFTFVSHVSQWNSWIIAYLLSHTKSCHNSRRVSVCIWPPDRIGIPSLMMLNGRVYLKNRFAFYSMISFLINRQTNCHKALENRSKNFERSKVRENLFLRYTLLNGDLCSKLICKRQLPARFYNSTCPLMSS